MSNLNQIMQQVKLLSLEEQRALNSLLCANIRHAMKVSAINKSVDIAVGDYLQFDGKTRGTVTIKVESFSRDRTKVKGRQVSRGFLSTRGTNWTVALGGTAKVISREEGEKLAAVGA